MSHRAEPEGSGESAIIICWTVLKRREMDNISSALRRSDWRVYGEGGAAELLGVKPSTLASRIKKMGLEKPR